MNCISVDMIPEKVVSGKEVLCRKVQVSWENMVRGNGVGEWAKIRLL